MAKKRKRYIPGGSSGALSMTAAAAPKQDPYRFIRDGKKQQVAGRANLPTPRQKEGASYILPHQDSITAIREGEAGAMDIADVALSLPGLAALKPIKQGVKGVKDMGIFKKVVEKGADLVGDASDYLKKNKGTPSKGKVTPPKGKGTPSPTGANRRRANRVANKSKETPNTATSPTSAPVPKNPVTPKVNKPKTPKPKTPKTPKPETPKTPTSGKSIPKRS